MDNNSSNWRRQDYFWLIGILVSIIVLICAIRLGDNADIVNIISFIASGMSIALAFIAIWWGQVNNSEGNKIYDKINEKLDSVKVETTNLSTLMTTLQKDFSKILNEKIDSSDMSEDKKEEMKAEINSFLMENSLHRYNFDSLKFIDVVCTDIKYNMVKSEKLLQQSNGILLLITNNKNIKIIMRNTDISNENISDLLEQKVDYEVIIKYGSNWNKSLETSFVITVFNNLTGETFNRLFIVDLSKFNFYNTILKLLDISS